MSFLKLESRCRRALLLHNVQLACCSIYYLYFRVERLAAGLEPECSRYAFNAASKKRASREYIIIEFNPLERLAHLLRFWRSTFHRSQNPGTLEPYALPKFVLFFSRNFGIPSSSVFVGSAFIAGERAGLLVIDFRTSSLSL